MYENPSPLFLVDQLTVFYGGNLKYAKQVCSCPHPGAVSSKWSAIKSNNNSNSKGRLRGLQVDKLYCNKSFKISKISQEVDLWVAITSRFVITPNYKSFYLSIQNIFDRENQASPS